MNQWISAVRRIIPENGGSREKCKKYHRGIFNGQFWNCCKHRLRKGTTSILKPLFHSSQKPTRKLAASAFKYCDWMKVLATSL